MPQWFCCVTDCNAAKSKLKKLDKYPWMKDVTFHALPVSNSKKARPVRLKWLSLIRRESSWQPTRYTRVCSRHFVGGKGPTHDHPYPTLFPYNNWGKFIMIVYIGVNIYTYLFLNIALVKYCNAHYLLLSWNLFYL